MDDGGHSEGYSTAKFRKYMTEAFEAARYRDAIVEVSHHGKPWVSIMSPQNADYIRKIREVGSVNPCEVSAIANSLKSPIGLDELFLRICQARADVATAK